MGFSVHRMPQIGEVIPGLWLASAFGAHGLNTTAMAGELIAAAITERDDRWRLFLPYELVWAGGALGRAVRHVGAWSRRVGEDWAAGLARRREAVRREGAQSEAAQSEAAQVVPEAYPEASEPVVEGMAMPVMEHATGPVAEQPAVPLVEPALIDAAPAPAADLEALIVQTAGRAKRRGRPRARKAKKIVAVPDGSQTPEGPESGAPSPAEPEPEDPSFSNRSERSG